MPRVFYSRLWGKPSKTFHSRQVLYLIEFVGLCVQLSVDPATGAKKLTADIIFFLGVATHKARINVAMIARLLRRAKVVSICFVLDTTGSMASYISGVKDQILEIV